MISRSTLDRMLPPKYQNHSSGTHTGERRGALKISLRVSDKEGHPLEHELHFSRKLMKAQYNIETANQHKEITSISADNKELNSLQSGQAIQPQNIETGLANGSYYDFGRNYITPMKMLMIQSSFSNNQQTKWL